MPQRDDHTEDWDTASRADDALPHGSGADGSGADDGGLVDGNRVDGDHVDGEQTRRELVPADVPPSGTARNPNTPPGELGIDLARLFEQASEQTRMAVCVTDPNRSGNPIVYVNQAFERMTGYGREEIVGRNCKFLQGPDTDPAHIAAIRAGLDARDVRVIEILNYRKDGTPFWNSLHIGPIYDDDGRLTHFYGSQWDVTGAHAEREALIRERQRSAVRREVAEELQHRAGNLFGVLTAIVRMSARGETNAAALAERVIERVDAMGRAHKASIAPGGVAGAPVDLHSLAGAVLRPYRTEREERIALSGPAVELPEEAATPIGLALHELATNALKYGALGDPEGRVDLAWTVKSEAKEHAKEHALRVTWTETGGPTPRVSEGGTDDNGPGGEGAGGTGSRLVTGVLRAVRGTIERDWRDAGLQATLHLPLARNDPALSDPSLSDAVSEDPDSDDAALVDPASRHRPDRRP